jgi:broad specificity phosphatase PhoE
MPPSVLKSHEVLESLEHMAQIREAREKLDSDGKMKRVQVKASSLNRSTAEGEVVIFFVRHGEGVHNVHGAQWLAQKKDGNPYVDPSCPVDPELTPLGRQQAEELAPLLAATALGQGVGHDGNKPLTIVTSPLRRAIQTAVGACTCLPHTQFLALERVHEQGGLHRCDARLPRQDLSALFHQVDFSEVVEELDPLWSETVRETQEQVILRAHKFLVDWVRPRAKQGMTHVAVFSHSAFLLALFNGVLDCGDEAPDLSAWFATGEMRPVILSFIDSD